jgi:hypothetical protein
MMRQMHLSEEEVKVETQVQKLKDQLFQDEFE